MRFKTAVLFVLGVSGAFAAGAKKFTVEQVLSFAFPTDLTAAPKDGKVAWVLDENGARNLWVAAAPDYEGHRLTSFKADDGQELAEIAWTPDAKSILYVRGGDFETGRDNPNPASLPQGVEQNIWMIASTGGEPRKMADGHSPAVSPKGDQFVFVKEDHIWSMGFGADDKPKQLIHAKGDAGELLWSPDGTRLAFVSSRTDHGFVGVYDVAAKTLHYLDASTDRDLQPVWSPDGQHVAFIRVATTGRAFMFGPERSAANPWSIRIADANTGKGRELWKASAGPGSEFHQIVGAHQLLWTADDHIVFPWEKTGYVHLYSISTRGDLPASLNTDGQFEVEDVALAPNGRSIVYSSNENDIDRRHLWRVSSDHGPAQPITSGATIEWSPALLSDGGVALLHSDAKTPARAAVQSGNRVQDLAPDAVSSEFPSASLVTPQPVIVNAADGMPIHAQLFLPSDLKPGERRPALVFFHGGSRRQMLLGFHYMNYYHNAYAMNQYLANQGYIVLAVNYRSGIGYGLNFREALNYGATGASEFNDVMGAGLYLRNRPDVDPKRIGLWGGSYGGYLTALGLARASDLFAAGVDFHGVHDWNRVIHNFVSAYDPNKDADASRLAFESSPLASVDTWRSPVLLIHGDDDRNVPFNETVTLVEALRKYNVPFEELIFPDEIHGFLTHGRWVEAYSATIDFFNRKLGESAPATHRASE